MSNAVDVFAAWNEAIADPVPDPMRIAALSAQFLRYFTAVQRKAVAAGVASGKSWTEIAEVLGITRQAAWQRFAKESDDDAAPLTSNVLLLALPPALARARARPLRRTPRRPYRLGLSAIRQLSDDELAALIAELHTKAAVDRLGEGERLTLQRAEAVAKERRDPPQDAG